jgi:hypothetical protein
MAFLRTRGLVRLMCGRPHIVEEPAPDFFAAFFRIRQKRYMYASARVGLFRCSLFRGEPFSHQSDIRQPPEPLDLCDFLCENTPPLGVSALSCLNPYFHFGTGPQ